MDEDVVPTSRSSASVVVGLVAAAVAGWLIVSELILDAAMLQMSDEFSSDGFDADLVVVNPWFRTWMIVRLVAAPAVAVLAWGCWRRWTRGDEQASWTFAGILVALAVVLVAGPPLTAGPGM